MTALTADELIAWVNRTSSGWQELATQKPALLSLPCDVRQSDTVADLLQHIVAVELRYAERLHGILPGTAYEQIGKTSAAEIYATHDQAMTLLGSVLERPAAWWEESLEFMTRSEGTVRATRRTVLVHLLMHSIRHYAQLATLARQHEIQPGWPMDYLFMGARSS